MKSVEEIKTLKAKSVQDLTKELDSLYIKEKKLKFSQKFKQLKNVCEAKNIRKRIARIWTIIRERAKEVNPEEK